MAGAAEVTEGIGIVIRDSVRRYYDEGVTFRPEGARRRYELQATTRRELGRVFQGEEVAFSPDGAFSCSQKKARRGAGLMQCNIKYQEKSSLGRSCKAIR